MPLPQMGAVFFINIPNKNCGTSEATFILLSIRSFEMTLFINGHCPGRSPLRPIAPHTIIVLAFAPKHDFQRKVYCRRYNKPHSVQNMMTPTTHWQSRPTAWGNHAMNERDPLFYIIGVILVSSHGNEQAGSQFGPRLVRC